LLSVYKSPLVEEILRSVPEYVELFEAYCIEYDKMQLAEFVVVA